MSTTLNYLRLYADDAGVSHFAPFGIEVSERNFAPPAPSFSVSPLEPASQHGFCWCQAAGSVTYILRRCACGSFYSLAKWNSKPAMANGM